MGNMPWRLQTGRVEEWQEGWEQTGWGGGERTARLALPVALESQPLP